MPANWISRDTYWYQHAGIVWLSSIDPGFIRLCLFVHSASFERMCERWQSTWSFRSFGTYDFIQKSTYLFINWSAIFEPEVCEIWWYFDKFPRIWERNDDFIWFPFMKLAYPFENKGHFRVRSQAGFPALPGWDAASGLGGGGGYQRWTLPVGGGQVGY